MGVEHFLSFPFFFKLCEQCGRFQCNSQYSGRMNMEIEIASRLSSEGADPVADKDCSMN